MKVAIFCETYLPMLNGVVTHISLLKEGLEDQGHEVLIVTADIHAKHHYIENNILHCPAISLKRFYDAGLANPISQKRLKYIKDFKPDICHIHQEFGIGAFGAIAAKMLKIPLVYTMHTMYEDYLYYVAPKPLIPAAKKLLHGYSRLLGRSAVELTGPSKKVENYFKDVGIDKNVSVIPNPVELDKFDISLVSPEKVEKVKQQLDIKENDFVAIFVGRLGREKSVDVLLDYWGKTIKSNDNIKLIIVGDGPVKKDLEELSQSLKLQKMVKFTGAIKHEQLLPYYAAANVYITASLSDTNSISMLEGMATGLPTLQIYDELNADQVVDGVNGYMFKDAQDMQDKLNILKNMSDKDMEKLRASVRNKVQSSGSAALASYIIGVYNLAQQAKSQDTDNDTETNQIKKLISRIKISK